MGVGLFPTNTLIPLQRRCYRGSRRPLQQQSCRSHPFSPTVWAGLCRSRLSFRTFASQKTELPRLTTVCYRKVRHQCSHDVSGINRLNAGILFCSLLRLRALYPVTNLLPTYNLHIVVTGGTIKKTSGRRSAKAIKINLVTVTG